MTIELTPAPESLEPAKRKTPTTSDLDRSLVHGIAWTGGVKTAVQTLSWLSTLVVARLLSPTDYGISGMAMVYVGLVQLVNEFGLNSAVVQRQDLTDDQIAKLGGLSALLGAVLCAISLAAAPLVAKFFGEPAVRLVVMLLSTTFLTSAFQGLPRSLLTRELQFRRLAFIDVVEALTSTVVTLTLAVLGYGYWSLVIGVVAGRVLSTFAALRAARHRLAWPFPIGSIKEPVTFGSHIAAASVAWYAFRNADMTVVGRRLGEKVLGAYTVGWTLASLPVDRMSSLISRATPAIFARVQNDPAALRRYVVALTEAIALMTVPIAVGMSLVADDFVGVVLGPRWDSAIPTLRILALAAVFRSTIPLLNQVLVATGQSSRNLRATVGLAIILPVLFVWGSHWGTVGVAVVWLAAFPIVSFFLYMRHALKLCDLSVTAYAKAMWPAVGPALVMTAGVLLTRHELSGVGPIARLGVQVGVGAVTYCGAVYLAHRRRLMAFAATIRALR